MLSLAMTLIDAMSLSFQLLQPTNIMCNLIISLNMTVI